MFALNNKFFLLKTFIIIIIIILEFNSEDLIVIFAHTRTKDNFFFFKGEGIFQNKF